MSHKDWKGPGWYDYWEGEHLRGSVRLNIESSNDGLRFTKREAPVKPEPPKKELPDGLYHVIDDVGEPTTWSRMNSEWRRSSGISAGSTPKKVIGRISVEDIS